jgi:hypothetical protein
MSTVYHKSGVSPIYIAIASTVLRKMGKWQPAAASVGQVGGGDSKVALLNRFLPVAERPWLTEHPAAYLPHRLWVKVEDKRGGQQNEASREHQPGQLDPRQAG